MAGRFKRGLKKTWGFIRHPVKSTRAYQPAKRPVRAAVTRLGSEALIGLGKVIPSRASAPVWGAKRRAKHLGVKAEVHEARAERAKRIAYKQVTKSEKLERKALRGNMWTRWQRYNRSLTPRRYVRIENLPPQVQDLLRKWERQEMRELGRERDQRLQKLEPKLAKLGARRNARTGQVEANLALARGYREAQRGTQAEYEARKEFYERERGLMKQMKKGLSFPGAELEVKSSRPPMYPGEEPGRKERVEVQHKGLPPRGRPYTREEIEAALRAGPRAKKGGEIPARVLEHSGIDVIPVGEERPALPAPPAMPRLMAKNPPHPSEMLEPMVEAGAPEPMVSSAAPPKVNRKRSRTASIKTKRGQPRAILRSRSGRGRREDFWNLDIGTRIHIEPEDLEDHPERKPRKRRK